MKKEFSLAQRPKQFSDGYLTACGNMSWYDFVAGFPSLVFLVTTWKSNGLSNACLQSWASFVGSGPEHFLCILSKVNKGGHLYRSLQERKVCVLNFPTIDLYDRCIKIIGNNQFDTDEITAAGLTAEKASKVDAPRIAECFLNIECEYLWEHEHYKGSPEVTIALKAVNLCMDEAHFDQHQLGRYGQTGYLFQVDQATNPETGETHLLNTGFLQEGPLVPWETK